MLMKIVLQEESLRESLAHADDLLVSNDGRIDLWNTKIEVYEVIKPLKGENYRMRCLHQKESSEEDNVRVDDI